MAFKSPFSLAKLKSIRANAYHQALKLILTKKLKDGDAVPFFLILNHIYAGFDKSKSEKLPFLVLGEPNGGNEAWKKFGNTVVEGTKKQKDFMVVGTFRRSEDNFMLEINRSRGLNKIPPKTLTRLDALLANINKKFKLHTREIDAADADTDDKTTKENNTNNEKNKEQSQPNPVVSKGKEPISEARKEKVVTALKRKGQIEAKELDEKFKQFRQKTRPGLKNVAKNVRKGAATKKDLALLKEVNQIYSSIVKMYKKSPQQIQEKFKAPYAALLLQKEDLYKLSMATKQKQQSVIGGMANVYYGKKQKRTASKEEIKEMQEFLKGVLETDKKRPKGKKAGQKLLLKAAAYALSKVKPDTHKKNPKVMMKHINKIVQKKMRQN